MVVSFVPTTDVLQANTRKSEERINFTMQEMQHFNSYFIVYHVIVKPESQVRSPKTKSQISPFGAKNYRGWGETVDLRQRHRSRSDERRDPGPGLAGYQMEPGHVTVAVVGPGRSRNMNVYFFISM